MSISHTTVSLNFSVRADLSSQHLIGALNNVERCEQLEANPAAPPSGTIDHQSNAMIAVTSSVAFLEAFVNEVYEQCATPTQPGPKVAKLSFPTRSALAALWALGERGTIIAKYQNALMLAGLPKLDPGQNPLQDAALLVKLRNELVHFRPEASNPNGPDHLEAQLSSRFAQSRFVPPGGKPWWPTAALGAGCARWAFTTAVALADTWSAKLDVWATYQDTLKARKR